MPQSLTLNDTVARSDEAAAEGLHDEKIILDLNSGEYFGTGPVGGFIWDQIAAPRQLVEVAKAVADQFEIDQEQAGADLLQFIAQLIERGLADTVDDE